MSKRPASCRLVQFASVLPRREYSMNSRIGFPSVLCLIYVNICLALDMEK